MKIFKSFLLTAFVVVSLISCSSDDDGGSSSSATGSFSVDGSSYSLNKGVVLNYGEGPTGIYNFDISLFSNGVNLDEAGEASGMGDVIYFELWTDQSSGLKEGTYSFSNSTEDFAITVLSYGLDCNSQTEMCATEAEGEDGTLSISRDGNRYTLTFSIVTPDGVATGTYSGVLRAFNS
ncbi:hypothetical protein [Nonlabens xiamenensis]|uniref:hypothetical protein n=1 Tax=Nonlabens xiamenensis TaxID=2341043 RepID=UPI000F612EC1|nr:hypothetical protein [Nonlabens xiamenensis]